MHVRNLTSMLRPEHHARKAPGSRADHMQQGASFVPESVTAACRYACQCCSEALVLLCRW